jgi:hypothetical protein
MWNVLTDIAVEDNMEFPANYRAEIGHKTIQHELEGKSNTLPGGE